MIARHCEIELYERSESNSPLNLLGRLQAERMAEEISKLGTVCRIHTSPLIRAIETSCYIARATHAPVITDYYLADLNYDGYGVDEVKLRSLKALESIMNDGIGDLIQVIVTHGWPIQCMIAKMKGNTEPDVRGLQRGEWCVFRV